MASNQHFSFKCFQENAFLSKIFPKIVRPLLAALSVNGLINILSLHLSDYLDVVKDPIASGDYKKEEDPTLFISEKTGRGPLSQEWYEEYKEASKDTGSQKKHIMCAYKLCRVEFKYWGMQTKIEKFIHDIGKFLFYYETDQYHHVCTS